MSKEKNNHQHWREIQVWLSADEMVFKVELGSSESMSLSLRCSGTRWIKSVLVTLASSQLMVIGASPGLLLLTRTLMMPLTWLGKYRVSGDSKWNASNSYCIITKLANCRGVGFTMCYRFKWRIIQPLTTDWLNMWWADGETSTASGSVFACWIGLVFLIRRILVSFLYKCLWLFFYCAWESKVTVQS